MEWFGIPWWVWVFVIPEVVMAAIWFVIVLPIAAVAALIERMREDWGS